MRPSSEAAPFVLLSDEGERPFDPAAIERELRSLWKTPPGARAYTRAALANVVVPLDRDSAAHFSGVIAGVARRHPARLIRISPASHAPPDPARLSARATALCHMREGGGGYVCSEEIVLGHTEATAPLLPSAVRSILIGDLPVVLLALTPSKPEWLEALAAHADIQIADSCLESRPADIGAAWQRTGRRGTPMHDLTWSRLAPWRSALAGLFDVPEAAATIGSLDEVVISHGGEQPPSPAWLLAGWLASRLSWTLEAREDASFRFRPASAAEGTGDGVRVALARAKDSAAREVVEVRLRASGGRVLDARLARAERGDRGILELAAPRAMEHEIPFVRRGLAEAIVGEIQRRGPNPAFRDAARAAREMIEAWGSAPDATSAPGQA